MVEIIVTMRGGLLQGGGLSRSLMPKYCVSSFQCSSCFSSGSLGKDTEWQVFLLLLLFSPGLASILCEIQLFLYTSLFWWITEPVRVLVNMCAWWNTKVVSNVKNFILKMKHVLFVPLEARIHYTTFK